MKYLLQFCFFLTVFTACKANKAVIDATVIAEKTSAKKVARKHVSANFDKKTVSAKLKVKFDNGKTQQNLVVEMQMVKDEVILLKVSKFMTVLRAKITPTSVQYYSPFFKNSFEGDYSSVADVLGVAINFEQLQNVLLGQAIQNVKKQQHHLEIIDNAYVLSPEKQSLMFDLFFAINPSHYKLDRQSIVSTSESKRLDILYKKYQIIEDEVFPAKMSLKAKQKKKTTTIDITLKTVKFNTEIDTSFRIPSNYKRIQ
ncbi:DUF4292 domain-containing protein [Polaribacter sp. HL-MS24]|uniref:DUF4292 domain-containing protein n=1 Tax=Polaribacter sp. HL-MS24 TaxID=3077735 RepID=UPI002934A8C7|nr:DUF4292 domain-containing protein [Polaribacter sp. HL-MS24]WOC39257.1 DUF4292 domain-containing protein [Polaribacter sp. HL-MS24]